MVTESMVARALSLFREESFKRFIDLPFLMAVMVGLFFISRSNYLLFHSLVEACTVAMTITAFALAWNTRSFGHGYLLLIGLCSGFLALFGVLHTLSYQGMGVFPQYSFELATQLWVASRYLSSITLLIAPLFLKRKLPLMLAFSLLALTALALLLSIFLRYFPTCFVEGQGLTPFKIISEYITCAFLIGAMILMYRNRRSLDDNTFGFLMAFFLFAIGTSIAFTSYLGMYDSSNMVGHLLQFCSTYFFYKAIVEKGLRQPMDLLFRDLKMAVQARDELISIASHELKTPLTPLRMQLQNFQRMVQSGRAAELTPEKIERTVKLSIKQIDRMTYLIESLMDATRLSTGKLKLNVESVDLLNLVKEIVDRHGADIENAQCTITLIEPESPVLAEVDSVRIDQVITNLLMNALKYAPAAKIEIGVKVDSSGRKLVWVADDGPGIPPDDQIRVFDRYERLDHTNKNGGLGLGLFISRQIVEAHEGILRLNNHRAQGSRFELLLK